MFSEKLSASLVSSMSAIQNAKRDHERTGHRGSSADIAEIRAARFLAEHGNELLKLALKSSGVAP